MKLRNGKKLKSAFSRAGTTFKEKGIPLAKTTGKYTGRALGSAGKKTAHYFSKDESHKRKIGRLNRKVEDLERRAEISELEGRISKAKGKYKKNGIGSKIMKIISDEGKSSGKGGGMDFGFSAGSMADFSLNDMSRSRKGKRKGRKADYWGFI